MISPKNAFDIFILVVVIIGLKFLPDYNRYVRKRRSDRNYRNWSETLTSRQAKAKAEYDQQRKQMVKH